MHQVAHRLNVLALKTKHQCIISKSPQISLRLCTTNGSQRILFDEIAKELNVTELSDWYKVSSKELQNKIQSKIGDNNSPPLQLLFAAYPNYEWLPWRFDSGPRTFWSDIKNQRKFMDWASRQLKINEMSDWFRITNQEIINLGGRGILDIYGRSMHRVLTAVYPEHEFHPWRFETVPRNFWIDTNNQRQFLEWAGKQLKIKEMKDWYKVSFQQLCDLGGKTLLSTNPMSKILAKVFPDYAWLPWKFTRAKINFWSDPQNWRPFMKTIAKELNIQEPKDWYKIKANQVIDLGGGILIVKNRTLPQLLSRVYSDFNWNINMFNQNTDIWTDEPLATYFMDWLRKRPESDVYDVHKMVKSVGIKGDFPLALMLKNSFPNLYWPTVISAKGKKSQSLLKESLEKIFTNKDTVLLEEYKHPDFILANNYMLELDLFYPQFKLAVEFQGQQHYQHMSVFNKQVPFKDLVSRDNLKAEACKKLGITLIKVPFWWDRKISSLSATIYNTRPDLFHTKPEGKAIPLTPPASESAARKTSLAYATRKLLMTATEWDYKSMEPKGWFMTEKYDGMRLYWNGNNFYSRQGEKVSVPDSIMKQMPSSIALDGELWTQYGLYQDAVNLAKSMNEAKWAKAVFWIFDAPQLTDKPIEERIEYLKELKLPSFAKVIEFVKCEGKEHLDEFTEKVLNKGGEGVILREPESLYTSGRSNSLKRHKPFIDTEVRVVKNQYPHGLICEQPDGKELFVRLSDNAESAKELKKGSLVTVKYSGVNVHGTLQMPTFFRERLDLKWEDVLNKNM